VRGLRCKICGVSPRGLRLLAATEWKNSTVLGRGKVRESEQSVSQSVSQGAVSVHQPLSLCWTDVA
jgi:hypothetical protein